MNLSVTLRLTIILIIAGFFYGCTQSQSANVKTNNQSLELRGIRLGMSFEELKNKYPDFTDFSHPDDAEIGQKRVKIKATNQPEFNGLEEINVFLMDGVVYSASFDYDDKFNKLNNKELTGQFETSLNLKDRDCEPIMTGSEKETRYGIWRIKKATFGHEISTRCEPFSIYIHTVEYKKMAFTDEEKSAVLDSRKDEIEKRRENEKPKVFQP